MRERLQPSTNEFENHLEFDALLADLSARLIILDPADLDHEIRDAQRRICELLGVELAVLWQWSIATPDVIYPSHAYCVQNELIPSEPMRQEEYPWSVQQVLAGRAFAIRSVDDLPVDAAVDRETCLRHGIKSATCVPLLGPGERLIGALGLNSLQAEREWPDELMGRLRLTARLFAGSLARRRHELTLRESEERLRLAAESAGAGLWTLDFTTGVFWATPKARAIFRYSTGEIVDLENFANLVHPGDLPVVQDAIEQARTRQKPVNVEYRIVTGDGQTRWINSMGRPQPGSGGEAETLTGLSIDVTDRKVAEEAFRSSEVRLASATDLAGLAFYEVDLAEGTSYFDERLRRILGVPEDLDEGLAPLRFWSEHLHPDDRQRIMHLRETLHEGTTEQISAEYRFLRPGDGTRWLHHLARAGKRDENGRAIRTFGVLRDITVTRQMEDEMVVLSQQLIRAHEEERALLARELHDDVSQRLAVLAIGLGRAENASSDPGQVEALGSLRAGLEALSKDVHSLAYQLHPSVLKELGLVQALRAEFERLGTQGRMSVISELDPVPASLQRDAALCLFRVAQEALGNVRRHSGVSEAAVRLQQADGGVLLTVRDSGAGFDPDSPRQKRSLGLASMRERVRAVNGNFTIESTPGHGVAVTAWVPLVEVPGG